MTDTNANGYAQASQLRYIDELNKELGRPLLDNYDISYHDACMLIQRLEKLKADREAPPGPWVEDTKPADDFTVAMATEVKGKFMPKGKQELPKRALPELHGKKPENHEEFIAWLVMIRDKIVAREIMPALGEINRVLKDIGHE